MSDLALVILPVVGILVAERVGVTLLTRSAAGCRWIRRTPLLHPNAICVARIPMGVGSVAVWELAGPAPALLWFAFWMITDLTDGTVARNCGLTSERGKWLDPLSDKCMVLPPLLFLAASSETVVSPPLWSCLAFAAVDVAGQFSRLFVRRGGANLFGKAKTGLVTLLLGLVALEQISPLPGVSAATTAWLTHVCLALALLSAAGKLLPGREQARVLVGTAVACLGGAASALFMGRYGAATVCLLVPFALELLDEDFALPARPAWLAAWRRLECRHWRRWPQTLRVALVLALLIAGCFVAGNAPL